MTQSPTFDHQRINFLTHLFGDSEGVRELYIEFLDSCPEKIAVIKQALKEGRRDLIEFAAHAIHGSSANIGVLNIEETSFAIETVAHNDQFDLIRDYVTELEDQVAGLRDHVNYRDLV